MPENKIGEIPDFESDETPLEQTGTEEVKQTDDEELDKSLEQEKETPTEPPADTEPAQEGDNTEKQLQGLQEEKAKLLVEIQNLRSTRREIKTEETTKAVESVDELKDLYPEDVERIDRIVKHRGYMTKEEANKMFYEQVKNEQLNQFLEKYPQYKKENDIHDLNWNALTREMRWFRMPEDPHETMSVLLKAHNEAQKAFGDRNIPAKQHQIKTAGVGAGGIQRSSSNKSLAADKVEILRRGGWSEEEIQKIANNY